MDLPAKKHTVSEPDGRGDQGHGGEAPSDGHGHGHAHVVPDQPVNGSTDRRRFHAFSVACSARRARRSAR
jgi:hypothetical protein